MAVYDVLCNISCRSYDGVVKHVLGVRAMRVYQAMIIVSSLGVLTSLLMLVGDFSITLWTSVVGSNPPMSRAGSIIVLSTTSCLPLALLRQVSALWFTSLLSFGFVCVLVAAVITESVRAGTPGPGVSPGPHDVMDYFRGFAIAVTAFSSQTFVIPISQEMADKRPTQLTRLATYNNAIVAAVYIVIG